MINIKKVSKSFTLGDETIKAVNNITFHVEKGEFVAIVGPSGSGKSTLMNVLGLLDVPDSGVYKLEGKERIERREMVEMMTMFIKSQWW